MRDTYESPLSSRYADKEMKYVFSPDMKFKTWRKLWIALAEAEHELGLNITQEQIDELRTLVDEEDLPVLCFGLKTDFRTRFFPGSCRLMELADSITEIKTICECGRKATVNARFDDSGHVITEGDQVVLGGNDRYTAMCYRCWKERIKNQK